MLEGSDRKLATILTLDGGGMRGVLTGCVLAALEEEATKAAGTPQPIAGLFDLVAGTSTGGILALALACPDEADPSRPRHRAEALVELYVKRGPAIFGSVLPGPLRVLKQLFAPKYGAAGLEATLREYLGDHRMHEAVTRVMVTSYDTARGGPYFFKSWRPPEADHAGRDWWNEDDYLLREAARGTSAAPTYFPPFALAPLSPSEGTKSLVDGGVFANQPGVCALAEAFRLFPPDGHDHLVVSVGTGYAQRTLLYPQLRWRGALAWAGPLLEVVFDGVSEATDYELGELLPDGAFHRFQSDSVDIALDDASPEGIQKLLAAGNDLVDAHRAELQELARLLVDPAVRARRVGPPARPTPRLQVPRPAAPAAVPPLAAAARRQGEASAPGRPGGRG
ncbi:MAG TPA: patatin-like phospholipase family protein [Anaeromyxobacter sp.]|nr:patatin-like phospholipase family protein [Anaeromyxobacter sp.]